LQKHPRKVNTIVDNEWNTILHYLVSRIDKHNVEFLVSFEELQIDAKNRKGEAALSLAVRKRCFEITAILLKAGADVNLVNNDLENCLFEAVW